LIHDGDVFLSSIFLFKKISLKRFGDELSKARGEDNNPLKLGCEMGLTI